jgi:hypothetical protein
MFTLSDIDAAASMAGQITEKTISRQLICIKEAHAAGLRFSNGLLDPSDVFTMEWDSEPEDQTISGIISELPPRVSNLLADAAQDAESAEIQESDDELIAEQNKEQNTEQSRTPNHENSITSNAMDT